MRDNMMSLSLRWWFQPLAPLFASIFVNFIPRHRGKISFNRMRSGTHDSWVSWGRKN